MRGGFSILEVLHICSCLTKVCVVMFWALMFRHGIINVTQGEEVQQYLCICLLVYCRCFPFRNNYYLKTQWRGAPNLAIAYHCLNGKTAPVCIHVWEYDVIIDSVHQANGSHLSRQSLPVHFWYMRAEQRVINTYHTQINKRPGTPAPVACRINTALW